MLLSSEFSRPAPPRPTRVPDCCTMHMLRFSALLLAVRAAHVEEDFSHAPDPITGEHGRLLLSAGCSQCCNGGNCLQGFNGMPGICCSRATPGCCPMGASCVRCNMRFICSNSA